MEQSCHHQDLAEVCRKRKELLQAAYQCQKKLQSENLATRSRIAELEAQLEENESNLAANKMKIFALRQFLLNILKDARLEKGLMADLQYCRFLGKCEACWLVCDDDVDTVSFESAGCNAATCRCKCHTCQEPGISFQEVKGGKYYNIVGRIMMVFNTIETDFSDRPLLFLTQKEKMIDWGVCAVDVSC